jgi:elongation factor P
MAVSTNNLKNGMCIIHDGKRWIIVEFQHVKPGKGGAFVRTKLKELQTGRVVDYTFRAGEKFEDVRVETKRCSTSTTTASTFHFMDADSYEQVELDADFVGDAAKWLKENDDVQVMTPTASTWASSRRCSWSSRSPRQSPASRATPYRVAPSRDALETGAVVQVPMFVETGDKLKIDTRDGRYITRV